MADALGADCVIVGGGPAGMMLALLLARAGVDVVVLEKHADFFRDFRGDTVHPSTLELMYELGILEEFLKVPHQEHDRLELEIDRRMMTGPDLRRLPTHCKFIVLMPQWDFLNFVAEQAKRYSGFRLLMQTEGEDVIRQDGLVVGVRARGPAGDVEIRANLVVAADGRHSTLRERAGFVPQELGAPMDVLWMRLPREASDPDTLFGTLTRARFMVMLNRGDYWQCAYVIPKGTFPEFVARGLPSFGDDVVATVPFLRGRTGALRSWDDVRLLTVAVNRLPAWSEPGLLFIGDAAHAMSPIGGVGINIAIGDAVAAANVLWRPLREGRVTLGDLEAVQRRRTSPVEKMQTFQVRMQKYLIEPMLAGKGNRLFPFMRLALSIPAVRYAMANTVGLGFQPEHVLSPQETSARA